MGEYLEFGETLQTKKVNNNTRLYLDLCYSNRKKVYVITLEHEQDAKEIAQTELPKQAEQLFKMTYFMLKTDENEKGEQDYYGR